MFFSISSKDKAEFSMENFIGESGLSTCEDSGICGKMNRNPGANRSDRRWNSEKMVREKATCMEYMGD